MTRTYHRKVAAIKKSVYVNIPSKISKAVGIAKGSVLYVTLEEGRVIFSKGQDEQEVMKKQEPGVEAEGRRGNNAGGEDNLHRLLKGDYTW